MGVGTHRLNNPSWPGTPRVREFVPDSDNSDGAAIVSGGMDSVTMVYLLVKTLHLRPHLLSFDYGQRHKKELEFARWHAERLGLHWSLIDLTSITDLISNSALTSRPSTEDKQPWADPSHDVIGDLHELRRTGELHAPREIEVPEGHYAEDNMRLTVVPNRNMMMLSIATAVAVSNKYKYIAAGMHAGDHFQYPDCREIFIDAMRHAIDTANEGFLVKNFDIRTPFLKLSKNDIADVAAKLDVPLHMTWSCYKGGPIHCGRCGTCVERLEAVASVRGPGGWDQTEYADTTYWKEVTANK